MEFPILMEECNDKEARERNGEERQGKEKESERGKGGRAIVVI